ncbi:uncharacterized protein LOC141595419 [Silene latifolia]|uniref:uncharacterized protein LOC141595419 n=1 Tax=Silene latifolia TaxID=37657 RepID=UPI003D778611
MARTRARSAQSRPLMASGKVMETSGPITEENGDELSATALPQPRTLGTVNDLIISVMDGAGKALNSTVCLKNLVISSPTVDYVIPTSILNATVLRDSIPVHNTIVPNSIDNTVYIVQNKVENENVTQTDTCIIPDTIDTNSISDVGKSPEKISQKPKWSNVVRTQKQQGMNLFLCEDSVHSDIIDLDEEEFANEIKIWETTLMGNVVGAKPFLTLLQEFVSKNWGNIASPIVQYFRKGWFSFRFGTKEEMDNVLKQGPWKVGANSLVLKQWSPFFSFEMEKVAKVPVWVLFPGLDPYLWSKKVLSKIARKLGRPLFADPATTSKAKLSFARVLIELDVSKTLPDHVNINIPYLGSVSQKVVYEWYPYFCHGCGKLGHTLQSCKWQKAKDAAAVAKSSKEVAKEGSLVKSPTIPPTTTSTTTTTVIDSTRSVTSETATLGEVGKELGGISGSPLVVTAQQTRNVDSECQVLGQRSLSTGLVSLKGTPVKHSTCSSGNNSSGVVGTDIQQSATGTATTSVKGFTGSMSSEPAIPGIVGQELGATAGSPILQYATGIAVPESHNQFSVLDNNQDPLHGLDNINMAPELGAFSEVPQVEEGGCLGNVGSICIGLGQRSPDLSHSIPAATSVIREDLWNSLRQIACNAPWLVLGDFNVVRSPDEKLSSTPPVLQEMSDFNAYLSSCQLDDLSSSGCDMTWTNKQDPDTRVWSKLDRVLVNPSWYSSFPTSYALFKEAGISDHSPILVHIFEDRQMVKRFSFLNSWIEHPDYLKIVQEAWHTSKLGSPMFCFFEKLKSVKHALSKLHKENYNNMSKRVLDSKTKLLDCQRQLHQDPFSPSLILEEKNCVKEYSKLKGIELNILQQRINIKHIQLSDSNSKYFFAKVAERQQQQIIGDIHNKDGNLHQGLDQVALAFQSYYQSLLGQATAVEGLDVGIFSQGARVYDVDQVFFKSAWPLIDKNFCTAIQSFFRIGHMSKQANSTVITLIPKKAISSSVMDYRPISCCTVFYKTVSKILANRLQSILPLIIGEEQAAFVKGRSIFENILLSQALVKGAFGFPPQFITWVKGCFSGTWYSLKLNGGLSGFFQGKSGIRGDVPSVRAVKDTLAAFAKVSGLHANVSKTSIYFGGVDPAAKTDILHATSFSEEGFPFRYLGMPLGTTRFSINMFNSLITKVQQKIHHWSAKRLSYAGKGIVDGGKKLIFKKWSQICAPWKRGGFNIKNVEIWNISLLIQWIWKLSTNSAGLWAEWHSAYILKQATIWSLPVKDQFSAGFKGILAARDKFLLKAGYVQTDMGLLNSWLAGQKLQVHSIYNFLFEAPVQNAFYSALIHPRVVPGHKIIALLAAQGKLATVDNLQYRGFSLANRCYLCQMAEETHYHLFFNCAFSGTVSQNLLEWLRIPRHGLQLLDELQWIVQYGTNKGWRTALFKTTIATAVYELWREHNGRIFSHQERTVKGVVDRVKYIVTIRMLMFPQHAHSQFMLDSLRN